jgi:serine/threonine-protein kinase
MDKPSARNPPQSQGDGPPREVGPAASPGSAAQSAAGADSVAGLGTEPYLRTAAPDVTDPGTALPAADPGRAPAHKITALGDYRLVRRLGAGGMGSVYLAQQISLDRPVAVKVMARELARRPGFVERFQREARLMARLDHPNIVRCFGAGHAHGWHYLAMEFVDGGNLAGWLKKQGRLGVGDALHVILACAAGLEHAHAHQLIHRDVKPGNVLISAKGQVKVADLGLAKALDEDLVMTATGVGVGTPIYVAPEQGRDSKHIDHRCDLYALGCMLYQCLAGTTPFVGETLLEVIEAKEKGKFPALGRVNPDVPRRLELITDKLLAARPEHRYQSCAALIKDLESLGMVHKALEFLRPGSGQGPAAQPGPRQAPGPGAAAKVKPARPAPSAGPLQPLALPESSEEAGGWYVTYTSADGRVVTKRMMQAEVIALIQGGQFDSNVQASKTLNGLSRDLGTYPEFARFVRSRTTRESSDPRSTALRNLYAKIEEAERKRARRGWLRHLKAGLSNWVTLLIVVGLLTFIGFVAYLLINGLAGWLSEKTDGS